MHASFPTGTSKSAGRVAAAAVSALLATLLATSARAHGGPPAILQVVDADAEGPSLVRVSEGFAQRLGERWIYVCPSLFGSTEVPRAIAHDGVAWLASVTGTYTLDGGGRVQEVPGDGALIQLALAGDALFGLRFKLQGASVVALEDGAQRLVYESDEQWTMLGANGAGLMLGRVEGEALVVQELSDSGELGARWSFEAALASKVVTTLRATEGEPFATTLDNAGYELFRIRDRMLVPLLEAPGAILGPMRGADGQLWLSTYDALWRMADDALEMHAAAQWITCFDRIADRAYACTQDQVRDFAGPELGDVRLDLRDLEPPGPDDGDLAGDSACAADWISFRADLSTIGIEIGGAQDAGIEDAGIAADAALTDGNLADAGDSHAGESAGGCSVARTSRGNACWIGLAFALVVSAYRARWRRD